MFRKQLKFVEMAKDDQVKDIKRKVRSSVPSYTVLRSPSFVAQIEEVTKIPIIAQRLFLHYQELHDASRSVADLELKSGDTLEVYGINTEDVDFSKLEDVKPLRGSKRGRSEGFGGTGLSGWEEFPEVDEGTDDAAPSAAAAATELDAAGPLSSNGNGDGASSSSSATLDATMVDADNDSIPCPECTFLNAAGMTECEMCYQSLRG
jgi:hypothetical protein